VRPSPSAIFLYALFYLILVQNVLLDQAVNFSGVVELILSNFGRE